jgi:hypothetical protein
VDKIALPDLGSAEIDPAIVKSLADVGRTIHTNGALAITPAQRREWSQVVEVAFGLDGSSQG